MHKNCLNFGTGIVESSNNCQH